MAEKNFTKKTELSAPLFRSNDGCGWIMRQHGFRSSGKRTVRMRRRRRSIKDVQTAAILAVLVVSIVFSQSMHVRAEAGASIDLFTQKTPIGGRGANESSDMFAPQESVQLFAEVLADGNPQVGFLVTFEIIEPLSVLNRSAFYRTAETNASGIAETEFSLRALGQNESFGTWTADVSVEIDGEILRDFLTFKVGWTVELLSVRTVDENLPNSSGFPPDRHLFAEDGWVGVQIALRNNLMTVKNASVAVSLVDELGTTVNFTLIEDLILPPFQKVVYIFRTIGLPKHTAPGNATVIVAAFDREKVSLCPEASTNMQITIDNPVFPTFKDDSVVYADVYPAVVEPGGTINATVIMRNEGTVTLNNISVTMYVNNSMIAEHTIDSLDSYEHQFLRVMWNTNGLPEGNYIFSANATIFPEEADLTDNSYTVLFEIKTTRKVPAHDVAITNVTASPTTAYVGDNIGITVEAANLGNFTETFNVTTYYDDSIIFIRQVTSLLPNQTTIIESTWHTSELEAGTYRIRAEAEVVIGEVDTANNVFMDGQVTLLARPPQRFTFFYLLILMFVLILLASLVLVMFLVMLGCLRRRRRKKRPRHSYVIIGHPHI